MEELVLRELSRLLHSCWREETVSITLSEVEMSRDLHSANVYYSVLGDRESVAAAGRFLAKTKGKLRRLLSKDVVLKYTPDLRFIFDPSGERGMRIISALDKLEEEKSASETKNGAGVVEADE